MRQQRKGYHQSRSVLRLQLWQTSSISNGGSMKYIILFCLFMVGCGQAPSANDVVSTSQTSVNQTTAAVVPDLDGTYVLLYSKCGSTTSNPDPLIQPHLMIDGSKMFYQQLVSSCGVKSTIQYDVTYDSVNLSFSTSANITYPTTCSAPSSVATGSQPSTAFTFTYSGDNLVFTMSTGCGGSTHTMQYYQKQ